jgi:AsmA protein
MDYSPLRKLLLDGTVRIDKLRIKKAAMEKIHLKIKAKNGIFDLDPMSMTAYQGNISANAELNVKKDTPKTSIVLSAREIQANPMLNDVLQKDFLEGLLTARMNLDLVGDDADVIKKTLTGKGDLLFKDGAIKGIDIDSMVRNIKTAFGQTEKGRAQPRTDFSELHIPFSVERGVVDAPQATLTSPLLRVSAKGKADLVTEQLDFRVEPKFVGTLKGQGDTKSRAGLVVPILVTGTFAAPKFRPDLEAMFKQKIEQSLPDLQKQLLDSGSQKEGSKSVEKQLKDLIKGFGQ